MFARCCLLLASTILIPGCAESPADPPETENKAVNEPSPQKEAEMSEAELAVVEGNSRFAFDLYARLSAGDAGNLFFSPNSVSTALAMTYGGAGGETEREMAEVLHFRLPQERLHPAFAALSAKIEGDQDEEGYRLHVANRLWGQQGYGFLPEFLETTRTHYRAELAEVDFARETEQARRTINDWVEQQTEGKIEDLLPSGVLDSLTRLVLTNAIYFKGDWASPFSKGRTQDAPFHVTAEEEIEVPMMRKTDDFRYGATEGLQVLELPYAGDDLSMLILLPEEKGGLAGLEEKLTLENLNRWTSGLRSREVRLFLPRFTLTSQFNLTEVLHSMGMQRAFDPDQADFSAMSDRDELFISAVVHKAFVDVNEEGTEAAAATGVAVGLTAAPAEPIEFRADHPFVFLIRDDRTGSILFLGRVVNPKG